MVDYKPRPQEQRPKVWKDVVYYSDGLKIAAHLYTPKDYKKGEKRPAILSLAGYTGMKDVYGMDVPWRLYNEGYFVLSIDYRGFGSSEGERGRQRPLEQAQDSYDGITYLTTVEGVDPDRIGIYGTSFGGANGVWVTAFDKRVKALVTSVMVSEGERWMKVMRRPSEFAEFKRKLDDAAKKRVTTGEVTKINVLEMMPADPHTMAVIKAHHQKDTNYVSDYDTASAEACMRYKPEWVAPMISPRPVLVIYAENDELCTDEALHCYEALKEPKKLVILPKAQHYESYYFVSPEMHEIGMKEAVAWFKQYL
jgi:pimeloyl-ACP methyl ester carboxylesterase